MDITYFVALFLAIVIGFVGSLVFLALRGRSYSRLLGSTLIISIIADYALLIDWRHISDYTVEFAAFDAVFFVVYGLGGCALGTVPGLALGQLFRSLKTRDSDD